MRIEMDLDGNEEEKKEEERFYEHSQFFSLFS